MKGISCEMGMPFLLSLVSNHNFAGLYSFDSMDPATNQGKDIMAKSYYQFKKRQKELDKKKKKEEKRQRKLESKMVETNETDETENKPAPSTENP